MIKAAYSVWTHDRPFWLEPPCWIAFNCRDPILQALARSLTQHHVAEELKLMVRDRRMANQAADRFETCGRSPTEHEAGRKIGYFLEHSGNSAFADLLRNNVNHDAGHFGATNEVCEPKDGDTGRKQLGAQI